LKHELKSDDIEELSIERYFSMNLFNSCGQNENLIFTLANHYRKQGDIDKATSYYRASHKNAPYDDQSNQLIAEYLYYEEQDKELGVRICEDISNRKSTDRSRLLLAHSYMENGSLIKSDSLIQTVSTNYHFYSGLLQQNSYDQGLVRNYFEKVESYESFKENNVVKTGSNYVKEKFEIYRDHVLNHKLRDKKLRALRKEFNQYIYAYDEVLMTYLSEEEFKTYLKERYKRYVDRELDRLNDLYGFNQAQSTEITKCLIETHYQLLKNKTTLDTLKSDHIVRIERIIGERIEIENIFDYIPNRK
jgi:hypothetical protein